MILRDSESYSTHIWIGLALLGGFLILVGLLSPGGRKSSAVSDKEGLSYSYEMPRVEGEEMPFDLSDREVNRKLREIEAIQKKKQAEAVKTADDKKAKAAAANKKAQQVAAQQRAALAAARARMAVQVVGRSDRFGLRGGSGESGPSSPQNNNTYAAGGYAASPQETGSDDKKDEELNLSFAQWRSLLQVQPTAKNIALLLKARSAGKISDVQVLEIVKDLLRDSADDRRKAALTIVGQVSSAAFFEYFVKSKAEYSADLQTQLQAYVDSFSNPAKLIFLGPILASSKDSVVLTKALQLLNIAVGNYKRTQTGQSNGQPTVQSPTLGQLQIFLATLRIVGSSTDTSVAQQAQAITQDIQNLRNASNAAASANRVASSRE